MSSFDSSSIELSERLLRQTNAWCALNGMMYYDGQLSWTHAPIAILPSPFPKDSFEYASRIQPIWNKLIDRIARDRQFLLNELSSVVHADEFTGRVMKIYESLPEEDIKNSINLGIYRSDYMLNFDNSVLQVEINTISASLCCLSKKVHEFHKFILDRNSDDQEIANLISNTFIEKEKLFPKELLNKLPDNQSLDVIAATMAEAHKAYNNQKAVILFIIQPGEKNLGDQRGLEHALWESHKVKCELFTLTELSNCASLEDSKLFVTDPQSKQKYEVSVAYYRAGYTPNDYITDKEWDVRALIEKSKAIKCPNAGYHLAGTKAIQAALCKPNVLEQYLTEDECLILRKCFAQQYSLGDNSIREISNSAISRAEVDGSPWVLKPQREGGGNNYYGQNLSKFLLDHKNDTTLSGYVLMQRIFPKSNQTIFHRLGKTSVHPSISELGIFGTFLGNSNNEDKVIVNKYAGYLLRTKMDGVDEGGVATGYSVLNSIALFDD